MSDLTYQCCYCDGPIHAYVWSIGFDAHWDREDDTSGYQQFFAHAECARASLSSQCQELLREELV